MTSKITNKIGSKTYTEIYTNEYDRADRIIKTKHKYGNTEVVLLENSYDDLGRLVNSRRLQKDALKTQVGYTLHSSVNSLKTGSYFEEKLHFEDSSNGNTPLYSGSISGIEWMVKGSVKRGYNYAYDKNKRLTKADYYDFVGGEGRFSTSYGYDNMGNITSLKRSGNHNNGGYGVIDNLTYSYNGNQLVSVDDAATSPDINDSFDFKDGADASVEYLYDANGNMIQDKNKGIAEIQYNHLNMPTRITYDNGNMIDYLYSASGAKLKVTHTTNKLLMVNSNLGNSAAARTLLDESALLTVDEPVLAGRTRVRATAASDLDIQTTDYVNGYILENGVLSQIQMNGGYMTEDSQGKAVYHFYLQDHQGNNRVVVNGSTLAVEQVNHYYPYGGLFAESTGGEKQPFKYNGKELDRMCGLNWYDHGARHNDAAIGRWHCIDPLAEKYYSISPYAYCAGDPVNLVDPTGCSWYKNDSTGYYTWFAEKADREGYTYVGEEGAVCGELEAMVDKIMRNAGSWHDKNTGGLYIDRTTLLIDNNEESDYMEWYWEFQNNTGPEIRLITNQSNPYIIDLKKEDTVIETQKEAIEKKGMATGYSGQWMPWHHITKGITKPILNFIGSYFVDSYSLHNINMSSLSIVYDRKSRYSLAGHMDVKNPSRSNSFGFGNTYQFYFLLNK